MPKQIIISALGIILSILIAIWDVKHGRVLWSAFWFVMIVLHSWIVVNELNKEKL